MKYNPDIHRRRSIRLKEYDYSKQNGYFVTILTRNRECLFGNIVDEKIDLNEGGEIVKKYWLSIPKHYPNVTLDDFVIMPNHIHGIIFIVGIQHLEPLQKRCEVHAGAQDIEPIPDGVKDSVRVQRLETLYQQNQYQHIIPESIGAIVRGFKIGVTKWFRKNTDIHDVWYRNYYEHIIRNENELNKIREYIINNPMKWESDDENLKK